MQGPSSTQTSTPFGEQELYSHEKLVQLAKNNQSQQQKRRQQQKRKANTAKNQPRPQLYPQRQRKHTMPHKEPKNDNQGKRRTHPKPNESFLTKSKAAALQQTKIHMEKEQNRSFIKLNEDELVKSPTIEVITLTSDSTQGSPLKVYTSNNKFDFMVTSPESPDIPHFQSKISTPKIDKTIKKIQQLNNTPTSSNSPIKNKLTPSGEKDNDRAPIGIKPRQDSEKKTPDKQKRDKDHDNNEEHQMGVQSPGKSSISDIKPSDFYEEFQD